MEGQISIRLFCFVLLLLFFLFLWLVWAFLLSPGHFKTTLLLENTQQLLQLSCHYQLPYLVCRKSKTLSYHQWQNTLYISNSYFSVAPDKTHGKQPWFCPKQGLKENIK